MDKILNFGSYKRRKVMGLSYVCDRLESLAHDMSVAVWVYYSPSSTCEEVERAWKKIERTAKRIVHYRHIQGIGGMGKFHEELDDERWQAFVREVDFCLKKT